MRWLLPIGILLWGTSAFGQLTNSTFRYRSEPVAFTTHGLRVEALQYLKNNEYFNGINPGETLFGFQAKALYYFRMAPNATLVAGGLFQKEYGDDKFFSRAFPILSFDLKKNNWDFQLGSIKPHIFHNLIEPLLSYENIIKQPVEYGFQVSKPRGCDHMYYDGWLNWKQKASAENGTQEQIVFGQNFIYPWISKKHFFMTNPIQAIVYHQGGQALNINAHIRTTVNAATGLRGVFFKDSVFIGIEGYALGSMDNSPTLSQPYRNGWALFSTLFFKKKYHEVAMSWWYAREFTSANGNVIFNNVNLNNPYQGGNTRRIAMLRYVYSRPIFSENFYVDFRLEPYYDFERKGLEFSQALYFRYVGITNIKWPKF